MSENLRDRVMKVLRERYPCAEVPYGTWSKLGRELGVSKERVRQIAAEAGWVRDGVSLRPVCACGGPVKRTGATCWSCRWVTVACDQCGRGVRRRVQTVLTTVNKDQRYSGRVFCNRECFAVFQRGRPKPRRNREKASG